MLHLDQRCHPKFICLGVQKTATTWLYRQFLKHPQFEMPSKKELRYFDPHKPNYQFDQYLLNFCTSKITGDMTPEYFLSSKTAKDISKLFPKIKLFVVLRNPIDRAFSHYRMMLDYKLTSSSFLSIFDSDFNGVFKRGLYDRQLLEYMNFFRLDENLKVLFYDDLLSNPVEFFSNICRYLGANIIFDEDIYNRLESKYKMDGLILTDEIRLKVAPHYNESIKNLSKILNKKLNWI